MDVNETRDKIRELDQQILQLAGERIRLAQAVGQLKVEGGHPVSDYQQELQVLKSARSYSEEHGLNPLLAEDILHRLIEEAVMVQENDRIQSDPFADGDIAVVFGGAGRMGQWISNFLANQGLQVHIHDPPRGLFVEAPLLENAEWVFMATPPNETAKIYQSWVESPPKGVLCDLCSIKTPLLDSLEGLLESGARVTSCHPMFGPETRMLRDHDFVVSPCGSEDADQNLLTLFSSTSARLLLVPLAQHDEWIADALALAHASALTFAYALGDDPQPLRSETLCKALNMADAVVHESPDVYFEIQAHNPHTLKSLSKLAEALDIFMDIVAKMDRKKFGEYMATASHRVELHRSNE
jgi:chorismate mutase/prephenate dehydrogenase